MGPIYCQACGRANGPAAKKCIWCGVPITADGTVGKAETTRVEMGYLDGLNRFEDPGPVRLSINSDGIEITELMPGSRSVKLPASSLIEANVVDASTTIEGKGVRSRWWWLALGPLALAVPRKRTPDTKKHDYILTIRYKSEGEIRNAVFHREDRSGLAVVEGLVRIVTALTRAK
ncbi:MAG TPA: hypothetical protein VKF81_18150 [Blastocatellia bacterium]|nr:hypothetical protein [Blastocatellia bacterium]